MLQEKYLQGRKERMQRILQEASAVADAMAAAGQAPARRSRGGGSDSGPAAAAAAALPGVEDAASWGVAPDGTPPALGAFVKALDERLINAMQETVMNMNTIFLQVSQPGTPPAHTRLNLSTVASVSAIACVSPYALVNSLCCVLVPLPHHGCWHSMCANSLPCGSACRMTAQLLAASHWCHWPRISSVSTSSSSGGGPGPPTMPDMVAGSSLPAPCTL